MKLFCKAHLLLMVAAAATTSNTVSAAIQVGDTIPEDVELHYGFPPEKINVKQRVAGKNTLIVGLPGAFTPTWSSRQVPGYLANEDALKALGVDEILMYCVNDGAVMQAWAEDQGVPTEEDDADESSSIIKLMGDPYSQVTEALDMELTHMGPKGVGLVNRCKRFALYVVDGVVKIVRVAESDTDPAGDDFPDITLAEAMMEAIEALNSGTDEL